MENIKRYTKSVYEFWKNEWIDTRYIFECYHCLFNIIVLHFNTDLNVIDKYMLYPIEKL